MPSITEVHNNSERSVVPDTPGWEYTHQGMIYLQHVFAYNSILSFCDGAKVLEVGCGAGYGAQILGTKAATVLAIDVSKDAVQWASEHNEQPNVQYLCARIEDKELGQQQFDVILSFQVIEHIAPAELSKFLARLTQLLTPNGVVFLTTPNRLRRVPLTQKPFNPHHIKEYSPWTLKKLLVDYFDHVEIRYVLGNEHVMAAEWDRKTQVTKARYYGSGLLAGIAGKVVEALFFASPRLQQRIYRRIMLAEAKLTRSLTPRPVAQWDRTRPFVESDFYLTSEYDWWAIDLFVEARHPRAI